MRKYGIIGFPVKHSFSPRYFEQKFEVFGLLDCRYKAYEIDNLSGIKDLVKDENLLGFNVTIPFKQEIIPNPLITISGQYNTHYFTSSVLSMISRLWDTQVNLIQFSEWSQNHALTDP